MDEKVYSFWNLEWYRQNIRNEISMVHEKHLVIIQPQEYDLYGNGLNEYNKLNSQLIKNDKTLTIYTGAEFNELINTQNSNINMILFDSIYYFSKMAKFIVPEDVTPTTTFTLLVKIKSGRYERLYVLNELFKHKLNVGSNFGITHKLSENREDVSHSCICDYPVRHGIDSPIILTHFTPHDIMLPSEESYRGQNNCPIEYMESSFDIVLETIYSYFFVTEKTLRPLVTKKPFMVFSCKDYHKKLRDKYGFKLYDNIIDYSFDDIECTRERFDLQIHELLKIREAYSPVEIFKMTRDTAIYNFNKLSEIEDNIIPNIPIRYQNFEGIHNKPDFHLLHKERWNKHLKPYEK